MKRPRALHVTLAGLVLVVAGFLYDLAFAGLPYQDPTAEMQAGWLWHKAVADRIILGGIAVFVIGLIWGVAGLAGRVVKKR